MRFVDWFSELVITFNLNFVFLILRGLWSINFTPFIGEIRIFIAETVERSDNCKGLFINEIENTDYNKKKREKSKKKFKSVFEKSERKN